MKFTLTTTDCTYDNPEDVTKLKALGFTFSEETWSNKLVIVQDSTNPQIELNSLEELITLSKELDNHLILLPNQTIEIYNGYRE